MRHGPFSIAPSIIERFAHFQLADRFHIPHGTRRRAQFSQYHSKTTMYHSYYPGGVSKKGTSNDINEALFCNRPLEFTQTKRMAHRHRRDDEN